MPGQRDPEPPLPEVGRPRLELSLTQILGSTGAAVTAAFLGSRLGVAGTLIGAALASVVSVVGGAVYTTSIKATRHRVAQALVGVRDQDEEGHLGSIPTVLMPVAAIPAPSLMPKVRRGPGRRTAADGRHTPPDRPGRPLLRGVLVGTSLSAVVFVAALTLVTGYESVSGSALAGQAGGLTVLGGAADGSRTGTQSVTPTSPAAMGSVGATAGATASATASATAPSDTAMRERTTGPVVGTAKPMARTNGPTEAPTSGGTPTPAPGTTGPTAAPSTTATVSAASPNASTPQTTPETSTPATAGSPIATDPAPSG